MKLKISLSKEYFIFQFFLTLISFLLVAIVLNTQKELYKSEKFQRFNSIVNIDALRAEAYLNKVQSHIEFIADKLSKNEKRDRKFIKLLTENDTLIDIQYDKRIFKELHNLAWVNDSNIKEISKLKKIVGTYKLRLWNYPIKQSKKTPWKLHFGKVITIGKKFKNSYIPVSYGITNNNKKYIGSIVTEIPLKTFIKVLKENVDKDSSNIFLLDRNKIIIAQPYTSYPNNYLRNLLGESDKIITDKIFFTSKNINSYPFTLVISPKEGIQSRLENKSYIIIISVAIALVLISSFLMVLLYRKLLKPIIKISNYANEIITDKATHIKDISINNKELCFLKNSLDALLIFRNNLSISNSNLLIKEKNISNINLMLYKSLRAKEHLYSKPLDAKNENVEITNCLEKVILILYPEISSHNIKISVSDKNSFKIRTNKYVLIKLLVSLLYRAMFFCKTNGNVNINVIGKKNSLKIEIIDDGVGTVPWRLKQLGSVKNTFFDIEQLDLLEILLELNIDLEDSDKGLKQTVIFSVEKPNNNASNKVISLPKKHSS